MQFNFDPKAASVQARHNFLALNGPEFDRDPLVVLSRPGLTRKGNSLLPCQVFDRVAYHFNGETRYVHAVGIDIPFDPIKDIHTVSRLFKEKLAHTSYTQDSLESSQELNVQMLVNFLIARAEQPIIKKYIGTDLLLVPFPTRDSPNVVIAPPGISGIAKDFAEQENGNITYVVDQCLIALQSFEEQKICNFDGRIGSRQPVARCLANLYKRLFELKATCRQYIFGLYDVNDYLQFIEIGKTSPIRCTPEEQLNSINRSQLFKPNFVAQPEIRSRLLSVCCVPQRVVELGFELLDAT